MPDRPKIKIQERRFDFQVRAAEGESQEMWVEGYATRFESPTTLYEGQSYVITEQIMRGAFDSCNMADVIFNYNHTGKVMARTRNKTLQLAVDNDGLFIRARLDGTEEGRRMYDEIQGGYVDKMSFRFTIAEEKRIETQAANTFNIEYQVTKIKKLYDVSAVDIPAYDDTSIEARRASAEEILETRKRSEAEAEAELELARTKARILTLEGSKHK